jgi:hypothetical protein
MAQPLARSPAVYDLTLEVEAELPNRAGAQTATVLRRVIRASDPDLYLRTSFGVGMAQCCAQYNVRDGKAYAVPSRQWVAVPAFIGMGEARVRLLGFERHTRGSYAYQWVSETHWASMTPPDGVIVTLDETQQPASDASVAFDAVESGAVDRLLAWMSLSKDTVNDVLVRRALPPLLAESALLAHKEAGSLAVLEAHIFDDKPTLPTVSHPALAAWRFALRCGPRAQDSEDLNFVWWAFVTSLLSKSVASDMLYHFEDCVLETYIDGVHLACKKGGSSVVIRSASMGDVPASWTFQIVGPMGDAAPARWIRGLDIYDIAQLVGIDER